MNEVKKEEASTHRVESLFQVDGRVIKLPERIENEYEDLKAFERVLEAVIRAGEGDIILDASENEMFGVGALYQVILTQNMKLDGRGIGEKFVLKDPSFLLEGALKTVGMEDFFIIEKTDGE